MGLRGTKLGLLCLLALLALAVLSPAYASASTTLKVTETTDAKLKPGATTCESEATNEGCTLRAAVELADETGGATTIEVPAAEYELTLGELEVDEDAEVAVVGAGIGKTVIKGHEADVFGVDEALLTLEGVSVEDGEGGIYVESYSALAIKRSRIAHNETYWGGGVLAEEETALSITESQIEENFGLISGGGVYDYIDAGLAVTRSRIADNETLGSGGGISVKDFYSCLEGKPSGTASRKPAHKSAGAGSAEQANVTGDEASFIVSQSTIEENVAAGYTEFGYESGGGGIAIGEEFFCPLEKTPPASAHADAEGSTRGAQTQPRHDVTIEADENDALIVQSTIAHNLAGDLSEPGSRAYGGGIYEQVEGDPIIDSTIYDNDATGFGGGVYEDYGQLDLVSDTVADNAITPPEPEQSGGEEFVPRHLHGAATSTRRAAKARPDELIPDDKYAGGNVAAFFDGGAEIDLRDTILYEPEGSESENCGEGEVNSRVPGAGYNLEFPATGEADCGLSAEDHDLLGVAPQLNPDGLQDNGGPTETISLASTSPAIGAVPLTEDCDEETLGPALPNELGEPRAVDQRGEPRPGIPGEGCDIGAYEYQQPSKAPEVKTEVKTEAKTEAKKEEGKQVLPVTVTSAVACASKRDIIIHIQNVKQFGIVSATVSIDGKHPRTLRGGHLSTGIDLKGLPKGTFTVDIVAHTKSGKTLHGKRVYHTCHTKLPGHSYLRL